MIELNLSEVRTQIRVIDSNINYWFVRSNGGDFYTDFNINNYVGIRYNRISLQEIRDVNNDTEKLKETILERYNDEEKKGELSQPGKIAGQLLRFANRIVQNDIVVVPSESSQMFLVGVVTGNPYELSDAELEEEEKVSSYKKSRYKKRIPIHWIGSFDRDKADSALYKMIFSQQTLSDVNAYKPYINRALFPVYIEDGELHITFSVTNTEGINGKLLGQFIYFYTEIHELLFPGESMDIKVNVQSPGPVESISKNVMKGLATFTVVAAVLTLPYGGTFKIGSDLIGTVEFSAPGIIGGKAAVEVQKATTESLEVASDAQRIENIEKALQLSSQLKVPVTELGIDFPEDLVNYIQKEARNNTEEENNIKKENLHSEDSSSLENRNSDEKSDDTDSANDTDN